jgi:hypothetical protein
MLEYEGVEVPKEAFLGLVEAFLNKDCKLYLIVEPLATKKEIGCSGQYCTEILKLASPDDEHTEISLEKPKEPSIEREYKCPSGHITKVYWYHYRVAIGAV